MQFFSQDSADLAGKPSSMPSPCEIQAECATHHMRKHALCAFVRVFCAPKGLGPLRKRERPEYTEDKLKLLVSREVPLKEVRKAIESPLNNGRFITITGELVCRCIVPRVSALLMSAFVVTQGRSARERVC